MISFVMCKRVWRYDGRVSLSCPLLTARSVARGARVRCSRTNLSSHRLSTIYHESDSFLLWFSSSCSGQPASQQLLCIARFALLLPFFLIHSPTHPYTHKHTHDIMSVSIWLVAVTLLFVAVLVLLSLVLAACLICDIARRSVRSVDRPIDRPIVAPTVSIMLRANFVNVVRQFHCVRRQWWI